MKLGVAFALAMACGATFAAQSGPPAAPELARLIQQRYATVHDFSADFSQSSDGSGFLPQSKTTHHGTVTIKKPSRMRWLYGAPDKTEIVADGTLLWMYVPADRRVDRCALPTGDGVSTAILFLAGQGDLVRDFHASLPAAQPANAWRLDLKPTSPQSDFDTLSLIVERTSLKLIGFITASDAEINDFTFTNLRENQNPPDSKFSFTPPSTADINPCH
jgi:outer membrane lipoprotein carrier protein